VTEPILREFGRKPYIDPGKGLDGGYVNSMRRIPQKFEADNPRVAGIIDNPRRGSIAMNDDRKLITTPAGLITEYISDLVIWGMTFDNSGGLYIAKTGGDILYRPAGSATFGALGQTSRDWEEMACSPINGDVWAIAFMAGIYLRAGGTGDFTLFAAGFSCVDAAANGDIYAIYNRQLYLRSGGTGTFNLVAGITSRNYLGLACAPNGDVYASVYGATGTGKIYVRSGGAGDLVAVPGDYPYVLALAASPNGDIFETQYQDPYFYVGIRAGGVGEFVPHFNTLRYTQDMSVSPAGILYLASSFYSDYRIYQLNTDTGLQAPVDTIVQTHATPATVTQPLRKNLKPYLNRSFSEMQQFANPLDKGRERVPETNGLPILADHIPPVSWYVRNGAPIVIDIPTTARDPIAGIEVLGGDGFASVAPNRISAIYKPGASNAAALVIHTLSGQQCTVNLMAK
jgi:hypothetical protein